MAISFVQMKLCAGLATAGQAAQSSGDDGPSVSSSRVPPLFSFFTDEVRAVAPETGGTPTGSDPWSEVFPSEVFPVGALVFPDVALRESSGFSPGWP